MASFVRCQFIPNLKVCQYSSGKSIRGRLDLVKTVKEQPDPVEGKIKGSVPAWISGRLLRVGPGLFEFGDTKYHHWFDGQSLLQSFTLNNGKVDYRSRYLRSETFKKNIAAGRIVVSEFGTHAYSDPTKSIVQRIKDRFQFLSQDPEMTENCNVNFYFIGNNVVVATETCVIYKVDPTTLETKDRINLKKYLNIHGALAHPCVQSDGTIYNLGFCIGRPISSCVFKIPGNGDNNDAVGALMNQAKIISALPNRKMLYPNYYHSFGMSENYIILPEQPVYVDMPNILWSNLFKRAGTKIKGFVHIDPEEKVCFRVVEKGSGKESATKYLTDSFICFHHINSYEDRGHLVVDLCCTNDNHFYDVGFLDNLGYSDYDSRPSVRRYVLPLDHSEKVIGKNLVTLNYTTATAVVQDDGSLNCTHEVLSPVGFDFPMVNSPRYNGRKYRFIYGVEPFHNKLVKLDTRTKSIKMWAEQGAFPSEPVYVPHPLGDHEDDGVVLSSVIRAEPGQLPYLLILDGSSLNEIGRVEFEGVNFPVDIHGIFLSSTVK